MPPAVISNRVPAPIRQAICAALLHMDKDEEGAAILSETAAARFVEVRDNDYDAIRWMAQKANEGMVIDSDRWTGSSRIRSRQNRNRLNFSPDRRQVTTLTPIEYMEA
jgi:hypothetical protein